MAKDDDSQIHANAQWNNRAAAIIALIIGGIVGFPYSPDASPIASFGILAIAGVVALLLWTRSTDADRDSSSVFNDTSDQMFKQMHDRNTSTAYSDLESNDNYRSPSRSYDD